ncbi:hypothetical protein [Noviherbaspirillum galbum]|uniref:Uncharacterized protein n=1 Tax=Noviherbaspirillum galbum TaxID=2709383 RepID=A0A6B3SY44_9BURK|nr:hypothetical protein [Noviherbaspirillum galbum]NEX64595.1 hypothetical protein [Noviherbaspirillum galbum]
MDRFAAMPVRERKTGTASLAASGRGGAGSSVGARLLGMAVAAMAGAAAVQRPERAAADRNLDPDRTAPRLHACAALLSASVLLDSALEHYRGQFENPGMLAPLFTASAAMLAGLSGASSPARRAGGRHAYAAALAAGAAGTAFHAYNILRRPGGLRWGNLFYAAPVGAPAALSLAGLFGLAARRLHDGAPGRRRLLGMPTGRALSALTCLGLAGTSGEAALLHFRGAFHHPCMWLPVTVPPSAAVLLGVAAMSPAAEQPARLTRPTRAALWLTALLGVGGVGFHARGVGRQMGGWRNWTQNVLAGPPLSAPPSLAALALAGFVSLALLRPRGDREARP